MVSHTPTVTVLELAGLESDNHTLTDIARHLRRSEGRGGVGQLWFDPDSRTTQR